MLRHEWSTGSTNQLTGSTNQLTSPKLRHSLQNYQDERIMFPLFEHVSAPRVSSELPAYFDFCVLVFEKRETGSHQQ